MHPLRHHKGIGLLLALILWPMSSLAFFCFNFSFGTSGGGPPRSWGQAYSPFWQAPVYPLYQSRVAPLQTEPQPALPASESAQPISTEYQGREWRFRPQTPR